MPDSTVGQSGGWSPLAWELARKGESYGSGNADAPWGMGITLSGGVRLAVAERTSTEAMRALARELDAWARARPVGAGDGPWEDEDPRHYAHRMGDPDV